MIEAFAGAIEIDFSVTAAAVIVRPVEPDIEPDVAVMVAVPAATPLAAPALLMVTVLALLEVHVTELVTFCVVPLL